jgi:hypothetical protein
MRRLLCNNQKLHIYLISRVITTSKSVTFPQVMSLKTCGKGRTISKSSQSDNRKKKHTKHEVFWTWHKTPGVNTKHEVFWTCTRFTWCDTKHEVFWTWHEVFFTWCKHKTRSVLNMTQNTWCKHKTRSVLNMHQVYLVQTQNTKCSEHAPGLPDVAQSTKCFEHCPTRLNTKHEVFWTWHKTWSVLNMQ